MATAQPNNSNETYQNWMVNCQQNEAGQICQMTQELRRQADNQRILVLSLTRRGDRARATLVAPFGVLLSEGVVLETAGQPIITAQFKTCLPVGCVAEFELDRKQAAALAGGKDVTVVLRTHDSNKELRIQLQMEGFPDAWTRIAQLNTK